MKEKPDYFKAKPGEILDWLRTQFPEYVLLRFYWQIGDLAVTEAMSDVRTTAEKRTSLNDDSSYNRQVAEAVDEMDPAWGGGHYPSEFMCGRHIKCPGYPRCKSNQE
ncbi:MAG: hypothetical protein IJI97_05765 [Clostridia bacterium]|nr:hypothetical protein [Clostridia bacterium]